MEFFEELNYELSKQISVGSAETALKEWALGETER
jgi:hypothetical protein